MNALLLWLLTPSDSQTRKDTAKPSHWGCMDIRCKLRGNSEEKWRVR